MRRGLGTMCAICMLLAPAAAHAGTASQSRYYFETYYNAAPGEVNTVTWTSLQPVTGVYTILGPVVITDATAPVAAQTPCAAAGPHAAHCDDGRGYVNLGDGNDRFVAPTVGEWEDIRYCCQTAALYVDGGPGNDTLSAGLDHLASLDGGAGNDTLIGGPATWVSGGPGDDRIDIANGHTETDHVSCGDGNDTLIADPDDPVPADCETVKRVG